MKRLSVVAGEIDSFLSEEGNAAQGLAEEISAGLSEIAPNGYVGVSYREGISPHIALTFAKSKDKKDWSNGIIENDPLFTRIFIGNGQIPRGGALPVKLTIESLINPRGSWEDKSLRFRKKTLRPDRVVAHLVAYFKKVLSAGGDESV